MQPENLLLLLWHKHIVTLSANISKTINSAGRQKTKKQSTRIYQVNCRECLV